MRDFVRKCLALLLATVMIGSLVGTAAAETGPTGPSDSPFWDTYATKYQSAVNALYQLQVVNGRSQTAFEPMAGVTRAEMATMVIRALGTQPTASAKAPFPDVPVSHWAAAAINTAASMGIVQGSDDGKFHPGDPVTYPQVVAMLIRALQLEPLAGVYPTGYVLLASQQGLIKDVDWGLDKPATRGDVALMLYRAIFTVKRGGFGPTLSQSVFKRAGSVDIQPGTDVLPAGDTQLTANVLDWVGNPIDGLVAWKVVSGNATVDLTGKLTAAGGPVTVQADFGGYVATKTYGIIRSLTITADRTAAAAGQTVQLNATGTDASGKNVDVKPVWSVVSGTGEVSTSGAVKLTGNTGVTVRATVGSMTKEITISVLGGITVSPATITEPTGTEVQLTATATATDAGGQTVQVPVAWSVRGQGAVDANGKFTVGNGPATITAQAGDFKATATVEAITRLAITPDSPSLQKGSTVKMSATAYTADNQTIAVPVTWSVSPSTLGFFGADGSFFGSNSGSGTVTATYKNLQGTAPVVVAGQASGIQLSAAPATISANGTAQTTITARLVDSSGNTATGASSIVFTMSSASLGTYSNQSAPVVAGVATTVLTAGTASGTYTISASAPGAAIPGASLTFTTTAPAVASIVLEAFPNTVAIGTASQTTITAKLLDASGAPIANPTGNSITVYLSTNGTAGNLSSTTISIPPFQYSSYVTFSASGQAGTSTVSGTSSWIVQPTTVTTTTVGTATRLAIRPVATPTKADNFAVADVKVAVEDANGNVKTNDQGTVIGMTAISGGNNIQIQQQTTQYGVTTFHLSTNKAGTYQLYAWAPSANLQADSNQVVFTAGPPIKVSLTIDPTTTIAADGVTQATLRAQILDAYGNLVTTAANAIRFVRDNPGFINYTTMPSQTTVPAVNGEATIQVTAGVNLGTDQFHAEADLLAKSDTVSLTTRITGAAVRVRVQDLTQASIPLDGSLTVKVWALDQSGLLATNDNGRMVYLNGSNGAVVSGPAQTVNGVATFTVTSKTAGGTLLTASADGVQADATGQTLTVVQGAPEQVVLTVDPIGLVADGVSHGVIKAKLVDHYGNQAAGSFPVTLTLSTSSYLTMYNTTVVTGGQTDFWAKNVPGTTTITGTVQGYPVNSLTINTYYAGTPTKAVIDPIPASVQAGNSGNSQVTIKVRIVDANGNQVTSLNSGGEVTAAGVSVSGSGSTTSISLTNTSSLGLGLYGVTPNGTSIGGAAIASGQASLVISDTRAETITLTPIVYYKGVQLQAQPTTLTTVPGPATRISVTAPTAVSTASPSSFMVTAAIADAWGNTVPSSSDTITFSANSSALVTMPDQTAVSTTAGAAAIMINSKSASGGNLVLTARSSRLGFVGSATVTMDIPADKPGMWARDSNGGDQTVSGGEEGVWLMITVSPRQTAQTVTVYANGVVVPVYTTVSGSTTVGSVAAGGTLFQGYIKRADLGAGYKEIRAAVTTPLGMSPMSDAAYITVQ